MPPHALKISGKDLDAGDFVMVVGYPGRTSRFRTADEVSYAVDTMFPRRIRRFEQTLEMMHKLADLDPELAIKVASHIAGYGNVLTNNRGMLDGLGKGGLAQQKAAQEAAFRVWIAADQSRFAKYGGVLDAIAGLNAVRRQSQSAALAQAEILRSSTLVAIPRLLCDIAEEREEAGGKLDARKLRQFTQRLSSLQKYYDRRIDERWLELSLSRVAQLPDDEQPALLGDIMGKADPNDPTARKAAIDRILSKSRLSDPRVVQRWFERGTSRSLSRASDPALVLAKTIADRKETNEDQERRLAGQMSQLRPRYVAALRAFHSGQVLAPDANGTFE